MEPAPSLPSVCTPQKLRSLFPILVIVPLVLLIVSSLPSRFSAPIQSAASCFGAQRILANLQAYGSLSNQSETATNGSVIFEQTNFMHSITRPIVRRSRAIQAQQEGRQWIRGGHYPWLSAPYETIDIPAHLQADPTASANPDVHNRHRFSKIHNSTRVGIISIFDIAGDVSLFGPDRDRIAGRRDGSYGVLPWYVSLYFRSCEEVAESMDCIMFLIVNEDKVNAPAPTSNVPPLFNCGRFPSRHAPSPTPLITEWLDMNVPLNVYFFLFGENEWDQHLTHQFNPEYTLHHESDPHKRIKFDSSLHRAYRPTACRGYKIVDFKPMFGQIGSHLLRAGQYSHWAWSDVDEIYGKFLNDAFLSADGTSETPGPHGDINAFYFENGWQPPHLSGQITIFHNTDVARNLWRLGKTAPDGIAKAFYEGWQAHDEVHFSEMCFQWNEKQLSIVPWINNLIIRTHIQASFADYDSINFNYGWFYFWVNGRWYRIQCGDDHLSKQDVLNLVDQYRAGQPTARQIQEAGLFHYTKGKSHHNWQCAELDGRWESQFLRFAVAKDKSRVAFDPE